jgi:hypothetical protein
VVGLGADSRQRVGERRLAARLGLERAVEAFVESIQIRRRGAQRRARGAHLHGAIFARLRQTGLHGHRRR